MSVLSFLIPKDVKFGFASEGTKGLFGKASDTLPKPALNASKAFANGAKSFEAAKHSSPSEKADFASFDLGGVSKGAIAYSGDIDHEGSVRPSSNTISAAISDAIRIGSGDGGLSA